VVYGAEVSGSRFLRAAFCAAGLAVVASGCASSAEPPASAPPRIDRTFTDDPFVAPVTDGAPKRMVVGEGASVAAIRPRTGFDVPVASIEDAGPKLVLVDDIITTFVGTAIGIDVLANDRGTGL